MNLFTWTQAYLPDSFMVDSDRFSFDTERWRRIKCLRSCDDFKWFICLWVVYHNILISLFCIIYWFSCKRSKICRVTNSIFITLRSHELGISWPYSVNHFGNAIRFLAVYSWINTHSIFTSEDRLFIFIILAIEDVM